MKTMRFALRSLAAFVGSAVCCLPAQASLTMRVIPYQAQQLGTGSGVQLGHTVIAGTNLNRLIAGGSFTASCDRQEAGTIPGSRTLTSDLIGRYNQLYVTIPDTVPSLRNIPGFSSLPRGTELMCQYNWKGFAREPTYTVGVPGFSITVGGEEMEESGVVTFWMRKPGTADGDGDACIP